MTTDEISDHGKDSSIGRSNESAYMSFILGVALLVMVPITLNFNVSLWSEGPLAGPTSIPMNLVYPAGVIGVILILVIALTSIILGIQGLLSAAKKKTSKVLPLVATFVSVVAFLLWVVVAIDLVAILSCFRFIHY